MALTFNVTPLSFLKDQEENNRIIKNTIILKYFYKRTNSIIPLHKLIEGTQYGYNDSAKKTGKNKFLRISDITNGFVDWEAVPYCDCTDEETYFLKSKDILIARTGGTTGKSFMISQPPKSSIYAGYLIRIRANESTIPEYINLFLNSYAYWSQIISLNENNFRPRVNAVSLKSLLVPNCPKETQEDAVRISNGEYLEKYDDLFEKIYHLEKWNDLEEEYRKSLRYATMLKESSVIDAFEIQDKKISLDSLFENVDYNLYVALIHKQIENRLKINYGEVATQKTVFNINAFTNQKIPYNFINSNHGTFSPQLKEDLGANTYLTKDRKGNGEVFIIKPSKDKEILDALSDPKNRPFLRAVNEVLDIYELPLINKETDKIELLNTVAKTIIDTKSTDLEVIYASMQNWEIKQNNFKTKAEKFSKTDTKKMITLIENLNLIDKLKKFS